MYQKIENEFIEKSQYYYMNRMMVGGIALIIILCGIIFINPEKYEFKDIIIIFAVIFSVIIFVIYVFILHQIKSKNKLIIKQIFQVEKNIKLYKNKRAENDLLELKKILRKNGVNSKNKLNELISHYRAVMPQNTKNNSNLISFISLVISLVALIFSEFVMSDESILQMCILVIAFSIILYLGVSKFMVHINLYYSKNSLYEMLEAISSEIYIKENL